MDLEDTRKSVKKNHRCIICGSENTEEVSLSENSLGEFVTVCHCIDCDMEFEYKR